MSRKTTSQQYAYIYQNSYCDLIPFKISNNEKLTSVVGNVSNKMKDFICSRTRSLSTTISRTRWKTL